jgi:hypothetical protein
MDTTADVDPQAAALLCIKSSVDTTGVLQRWTLEAGANGGYCQWAGVSCTGGKVNSIDLRRDTGAKTLRGVLPPAAAFTGLDGLARFALTRQPGISGTLPADWSQLQQLQDVRLSANALAPFHHPGAI